MSSGTIALTRTGSGYLSGQILWSSKSNGSAANTSTVTAILQLQRSALNSTTGTFKGLFAVGTTAKTVSWYGTLPSYEWVTVETITATVSHNTDGYGSCYLHALINGPTQTTMEGTSVSGSSTVTLDRIPRYASILSATDFTDEGNPTITYSNPAGTAVSSLQACISLDGSDDDVPYRDIPKTGTKYTFSLTDAERNTLRAATPNSNNLQLRVFVRSKIGDVDKAYSVKSTMTVVNANPAVSATAVDTNSTTTALTGNSSILVALHSKAKVTINATAKKYATVKSKKVTHGTASLTGDGTLSVTNNPIKITVTDSRGNTTTQNAANAIIPYINPTCSIGNNLPEAGGSFTLRVTGLFYNGAIGKTTNALTVQYRYKAAGGSYGSWTTFASVTKNGNGYAAVAYLNGFDYQTVYTIQARVLDSLHTSGVYAADKSVIAEPVFDWGRRDFRFNVPVNLKDGCDIQKNGATAYAPYGFGLGKSSASVSDLNTCLTNGRYWTGSSTLNTPITYSTVHVRTRLDGQVVQTLFGMNTLRGCQMYRHTLDGGVTWIEEWVTPPMDANVGYRTTERWKGKAVYVMLINCETLPSSGSKSVSTTIPGTANIISAAGITVSGGGVSEPMPCIEYNGTINCAFFVTAGKNININVFSDMSAFTGYITVKYTLD